MKYDERELQRIGPWPAGTNNLSAEHAVPPRSFREGVNVRVADNGEVSRRDGYSLLFDLVEPHSAFGFGMRAFFAQGTTLYATEMYEDGSMSEAMPIFEGIERDAPLAYAVIEPDIYVSDGALSLRISSNNTVTQWAPPQAPTPTTNGALTGGGSLPPGRYQIALAYRLANGEEGPLSPWLSIDVASIEQPVIAFPAAPAPVERQLIYMSKPDGTALLLYGSVPASATSATLTKLRLGREPVSDGLESMPPSRFAAYYAGRLLAAVEDMVVWSEPMQYSLTSIEFNYTLFAEPVTGLGVVGETTDGFFVGQLSRTYFVRGDNPNDARLQEVYPSGMVPGTLSHVPGARLPLEAPPTVPVPCWLATNGVVCVGLQDGTVLPLTEPRFVANVGDKGASVFEQRNGVSQFLVTTANPSDNVFAIQDQVSIEVVRNGISP